MKKNILKLAVLSISMLQAIISGISPILADIKKAFPHISEDVILQLLSLPFIFTIPASLLSGKLSEKFSKKSILLAGTGLTTAAGATPMFIDNFTLILLTRILVGIGVGLVIPFMVSLIVDFYEGYEREHMFGVQGTFVCFGSITYYLFGGLLGSVSWHLNFAIFFIGLFIIVLIALYLPDKHEKQDENITNYRITKKELLVCFLVFIPALLITVFTARLSFLITNEGIGNAATTGIITTFTSVGGLIAGLYFGKLSKKISKYVISLAVFLAGLGIFIAAFAHRTETMILAASILGSGSALSIAAFMTIITSVSSKQSNTFVTAIFMSSISLGMSGAPLFTSAINYLLPSLSNRGIYTLTSILLMLYSAVSLVIISMSRKESLASESNIKY